MSALFKRTLAVLPLAANEDHTGKEGYVVKVISGKAALVTNGATDQPLGIILDGASASGKSSVAVCDACPGTVRVKLDATPGTIAIGTYLVPTNTGTVKADPGTGSRMVFARALESGSANELIEAILFHPIAAS